MQLTRERQSHIFEKDPRGHYVEPHWVSQRLFKTEKFTGPIYDPACGWGRILAAASVAGYEVYGSDLIDRGRHKLRDRFTKLDFLNCRAGSAQLAGMNVVSNPPFDHVQEFCERALWLSASRVAMICLVRRLNAAVWLKRLPLQRVLLLTPRPSMPTGAHIIRVERGEIDPNTGKPARVGGGTQDFCWLVFDRSHRGEAVLSWLHRDGG